MYSHKSQGTHTIGQVASAYSSCTRIAITTPVTCVTNVTPPVDSANSLTNVSSNSSDIAGLPVIIETAGANACTALANTTPGSQAGTPQILSQPGSALSQDHLHSVPTMHLPSHPATPLIPTASPTGHTGPVTPMKNMSQLPSIGKCNRQS